MAGNVWEATSAFFPLRHASEVAKTCCTPRNPRIDSAQWSFAAEQLGARIPRKVVKGGPYLCAPNYCLRYRPAARQGETIDTSTCHIRFRCIVRKNAATTEDQREPR
jgi:formylglycine-generating enzyme